MRVRIFVKNYYLCGMKVRAFVLIGVYFAMLCISFGSTLRAFESASVEAYCCCSKDEAQSSSPLSQAPAHHICCNVCNGAGFVVPAVTAVLPMDQSEEMGLTVGYISPIYLSPNCPCGEHPPKIV